MPSKLYMLFNDISQINNRLIKHLLLVIVTYPLYMVYLIPGFIAIVDALLNRAVLLASLIFILLLVPVIGNVLGFTILWYISIALLLLITCINLVVNKEIKLLLASIILAFLSIIVFREGVNSIYMFMSSFNNWVVNGNGIIPVYTMVLVNTILMTALSEFKPKESKSINWEATPIILFVFLLIAAAVMLALGHGTYANRLAELAYYSLVIGVIVQLAELV